MMLLVGMWSDAANLELLFDPTVPFLVPTHSLKGNKNICKHKILYTVVDSNMIHNSQKSRNNTDAINWKMKCGISTQWNIVCVLSCVRFFGIPRTVTHQAPLCMGFPGQEYWSGCHFLLPGIFLTHRSKSVSSISCIGRQIFHHSCRLGSPLEYYLIIERNVVLVHAIDEWT